MPRDRIQSQADQTSDASASAKMEKDQPEGQVFDLRGSSERNHSMVEGGLLEREASAVCMPLVRRKGKAAPSGGALSALLSTVFASSVSSGSAGTDPKIVGNGTSQKGESSASRKEFAQGSGDARTLGVAGDKNTPNGVKKELALLVRAVSVARLNREHFSAVEREELKDLAKQLYDLLHSLEYGK